VLPPDYLGGEFFANHCAASRAWATFTPFHWLKQAASHLGGTRDLKILPAGLDSWDSEI
jgi:hypothetical protein